MGFVVLCIQRLAHCDMLAHRRKQHIVLAHRQRQRVERTRQRRRLVGMRRTQRRHCVARFAVRRARLVERALHRRMLRAEGIQLATQRLLRCVRRARSFERRRVLGACGLERRTMLSTRGLQRRTMLCARSLERRGVRCMRGLELRRMLSAQAVACFVMRRMRRGDGRSVLVAQRVGARGTSIQRLCMLGVQTLEHRALLLVRGPEPLLVLGSEAIDLCTVPLTQRVDLGTVLCAHCIELGGRRIIGCGRGARRGHVGRRWRLGRVHGPVGIVALQRVHGVDRERIVKLHMFELCRECARLTERLELALEARTVALQLLLLRGVLRVAELEQVGALVEEQRQWLELVRHRGQRLGREAREGRVDPAADERAGRLGAHRGGALDASSQTRRVGHVNTPPSMYSYRRAPR